METFIIKALQLILALSILVLIHEFGHYFFSRVFKVRVEKFYMFFHPWFKLAKYMPKNKGKKWYFFCKNDSEAQEKAKLEELNATGDAEATWRDTEYGIGWLPLGGYCKISGMIDESMDKEQMALPPKPWEFRSKPAFQRLMIMVGGVLFNFLLAIVIYAGIVYAYGEKYVPFKNAYAGMIFSDYAHNVGFEDGDIPLKADGKAIDSFEDLSKVLMAKSVTVLRNQTDTVNIALPADFLLEADNEYEKTKIQFMTYRVPVVVKQVQPRMGAEDAGMQGGDRILSVAGVSTPGYDVFKPELEKNAGKSVEIKYIRKGKEMASNVEIDENGKIGIMLSSPIEIYDVVVNHYNIFQSIPRGISMGWNTVSTYVSSLKYVFTSKEGAQSLGGFGTLGSIFPEKWDWLEFWNTTAFFSLILAVMNILPIPALDGGHVLFLLWEIVTRRKPSDKFLENAQIVGMMLLFGLLLYANANDIYRFFIK
ncbi:MAG: RIP metalloprotease RseP [bacterium]|nr:RIP metalloprotease RseP [bacterium]